MDLRQMTDLLSSLMASQETPAAEASPVTEATAAAQPSEAAASEASAPDLGPLMEMAMQAAPTLLKTLSENGTDLSGLMQSFLGSGGTPADTGHNDAAPDAVKASPPFDLSVVANAVKALGAPNAGGASKGRESSGGRSSNQKTQLLRALKPYVNQKRAGKIDRAISMLDTAYAARTALRLFTTDKK